MAISKPRKPKKTSTFTWHHLKTFFFFSFFTFLFLFYPGDSFYIDLFAYNRNFLSDETIQKTQFDVLSVPYIKGQQEIPFISAQGAYIIDLDTWTPLFEKNINNRYFPASTTKVITALTAFDVFKLDDVLEVKRVVDEGQSVDLIQGEKLTFESLLYGLLIHSGNDAAYVIADNYPGGYDAFIHAMNVKTHDLNMKNSQFKDPAGFDTFDQYTTVADLALAGRELLENKTLAKIVSTKSITISDVDYTYFHPLYNVNRLLGEIPGVAGLKTGKTELAGENLVTFYKKNGHQFLIVLLKSEDRFNDTENIVKWIDGNVGFVEL